MSKNLKFVSISENVVSLGTTTTKPHITTKVILIQVQNGNGVLNGVVPCLNEMHGTCLLSTPGQFGPVLLP